MATVTSGRLVMSDAERCGGQAVQAHTGTENLRERSGHE